MSTPSDLSEATVAIEPLTLLDRCDRCNAQAFVRASILTEVGLLPLLFCSHHYREHAEKLTSLAAVVQDESERINERPGS